MFIQKKLFKKIKSFLCFLYSRFIYILSQNYVYKPIFCFVTFLYGYLFPNSGYYFMIYSSLTYSFLVLVLTRPLFYLSVYLDEQNNNKDSLLDFIKTYGTINDLYYFRKTKRIYRTQYHQNYKSLAFRVRLISLFSHPNFQLFSRSIFFFNIIGFAIDFPIVFPLFASVAYPNTNGIFIVTPSIFFSIIENLPDYDDFTSVNIKDISLTNLLENYFIKNKNLVEELPLEQKSLETRIKSFLKFLKEHIESHHGFGDPELIEESSYDTDAQAAQKKKEIELQIERDYNDFIDKRNKCAAAAESRRT